MNAYCTRCKVLLEGVIEKQGGKVEESKETESPSVKGHKGGNER